MHFDAAKFPTATRYLAALPSGMASYPECRAKTDAFEELLTDFPELESVTGAPPALQSFLAGTHRDTWLHEVASTTALLMGRDLSGSDEAFLRWCYEHNSKLFQKPLYRALMYLLSTTLLVMGATKRWSSFHVGTTLTARPVQIVAGRVTTRATLEFPPHLYDRLLLAQFAEAFRAAVVASKAKEAAATLENVGDTHADFVIGWTQ